MLILNPAVNIGALRAISFDYDEVLAPYQYMDKALLLDVYRAGNAETVMSFFPEMSPKEASDMAFKGYNEAGDPISGFLDMAKDAGWLDEAFHKAFNERRNEILWRIFSENYPEIFTPCLRVISALRDLHAKGMQMGVVTHSHAGIWAKPALDLQGISSSFKSVLGIDSFIDNKGG